MQKTIILIKKKAKIKNENPNLFGFQVAYEHFGAQRFRLNKAFKM